MTGLGPLWDDEDKEETVTACPVCNTSKLDRCHHCHGTGLKELVPIGKSMHRRIQCTHCGGVGVYGPCRFCDKGQGPTGMVRASQASGFRRTVKPA